MSECMHSQCRLVMSSSKCSSGKHSLCLDVPLKHASRVPGSMNYDVVGMHHNSIGSYYLQDHVLRNEHNVFVYVP